MRWAGRCRCNTTGNQTRRNRRGNRRAASSCSSSTSGYGCGLTGTFSSGNGGAIVELFFSARYPGVGDLADDKLGGGCHVRRGARIIEGGGEQFQRPLVGLNGHVFLGRIGF